MGIKQLFSIIKDEAPEAVKEGEIKNQFGRKVAIVCFRPLPNPSVSFVVLTWPGCVHEHLQFPHRRAIGWPTTHE